MKASLRKDQGADFSRVLEVGLESLVLVGSLVLLHLTKDLTGNFSCVGGFFTLRRWEKFSYIITDQ